MLPSLPTEEAIKDTLIQAFHRKLTVFLPEDNHERPLCNQLPEVIRRILVLQMNTMQEK